MHGPRAGASAIGSRSTASSRTPRREGGRREGLPRWLGNRRHRDRIDSVALVSVEARIAALADLHTRTRAGEIERHSPEWHRLRERARNLDPVFRERRAAYQRAQKALKRGDPSGMEA